MAGRGVVTFTQPRVPALPASSFLYTPRPPARPARRPPKKRSRSTVTRGKKRSTAGKQKRTAAPKRRKPANTKRKAPKRKTAKRSSKPKLKKQKLIAPRKKPPKRKKAPKLSSEPDLIERDLNAEQERLREELRDDWKTIDPFADLDIEASSGGALDEDEDKWEVDPYGDPDAPGFDRFKDLPQGMDVHDYIAWLAEEYDLDMGQLYEEYFGDEDS